jgi:uncharacterized protein YbaR (Trm112 family)
MKKKLLDILVCPQCKSEIRFDQDNHELVCTQCNLAYPVRDGIPVLLASEARTPDSDQAGDQSA